MKNFPCYIAPNDNWMEAYSGLNLCGGKIEFILDDDQDMITIDYEDGMLIDVGQFLDHCYYITVVSSDDELGWSDPLAMIRLADKKDLSKKLQEIVLRFRQI